MGKNHAKQDSNKINNWFSGYSMFSGEIYVFNIATI